MIESLLEGGLPTIDYSRHPAYDLEPDPELGRRARAMLDPLIEEMTRRERFRSEHFGYRFGYADEEGERLVREGQLHFQLSDRARDALLDAAQPAMDATYRRMASIRAEGHEPFFSHRFEHIDKDQDPAMWTAVHRALKEVRAYDLTRAYFNASGVKVRNVATLVSPPGDHEVVVGVGQDGPSPAVGFHVDSSGRTVLKIVLYLSDVGPGDGPFGLSPGSHRWNAGAPDRIVRRAFDKSDMTARSPREQRMFMSLPQEMQVKAGFGSDMLAEWPQTRALVDSESITLGGPGRLVLFDPEAMHRGGMSTTGERRAVLISLQGCY